MLTCFKSSFTAASVAVALSAVLLSAPTQANAGGNLAVDDVEGDLSVMVLGSGGPQFETSGRASAGYLVFADSKPVALMDTGSGTYKSVAMSGAHIGLMNYILLSHMHIDHASELPGMVKGMYFDARLQGQSRTAPIEVYGPDVDANGMFPSASQYMDGLFAQGTGLFRYLRRFVGGVDGAPQVLGTFGYSAHNLSPVWDQGYNPDVIIDDTVDSSELKITEVAVDHFEAPAIAYRVDYKGHSIVYTGDTHSTSENITQLATGADILIYDTSILDNAPPSFSPFAKRHTTPMRIGVVAAAAGVKTLVLSHLTPISEPNIDAIIAEIEAQGYTGHIRVAKDLRVYNTDD